MLKIKDFMEIINYRITEGSDYGWQCFGNNAYSLDSWDGRHEDGHSLSITFDTQTQVVYSVEACDYKNNRAYRLINPLFRVAHAAEVKHRDISDQAWEDDNGDPVNWTDLEADEDFEEKANAIAAGEDYDTRVSIPIDLPEDELMVIFKMAHEADMTFNDYVEKILREKLADAGFVAGMKAAHEAGK